eukprot:5050383-Amphidinium_carterae.1
MCVCLLCDAFKRPHCHRSSVVLPSASGYILVFCQRHGFIKYRAAADVVCSVVETSIAIALLSLIFMGHSQCYL